MKKRKRSLKVVEKDEGVRIYSNEGWSDTFKFISLLLKIFEDDGVDGLVVTDMEGGQWYRRIDNVSFIDGTIWSKAHDKILSKEHRVEAWTKRTGRPLQHCVWKVDIYETWISSISSKDIDVELALTMESVFN